MKWIIGIAGLSLIAAGCNPSPAPKPKADSQAHVHEHHAPHGGALAELGEEFAHVEVTLTKEGELRLYLLDGESENPVRSKQAALNVKMEGGSVLSLSAAANPLTGETVGDSSEFAGTFPALKGKDHFHGTLERVELLGSVFENVELKWPDGDHGDHH